jgi:hypothetical protein
MLSGYGHDDPEFKDFVYRTLEKIEKRQDGKFYKIIQVFNEVLVPKGRMLNTWNIIFHDWHLVALVDKHPKPFESTIKLTPAGFKYMDDIRNSDYENERKFHEPLTVMTLQETMEVIFQKHREQHGRLRWTKSTFSPNIPDKLEPAFSAMKQMKALDEESRSPRISMLNYKILDCETFEQAKQILSGADKLQAYSVTTGHGSMVNIGDIHMKDLAFQPAINPPIISPTADAKHANKNSIIRWLYIFFKFVIKNIWAILIAVAAGLIIAYIVKQQGWI